MNFLKRYKNALIISGTVIIAAVQLVYLRALINRLAEVEQRVATFGSMATEAYFISKILEASMVKKDD